MRSNTRSMALQNIKVILESKLMAKDRPSSHPEELLCARKGFQPLAENIQLMLLSAKRMPVLKLGNVEQEIENGLMN